MKIQALVGCARSSVISSFSASLAYAGLYVVQGVHSGKVVLSLLVRDDLQVAGVIALLVFGLAFAVNWLFAQVNPQDWV